MLKEKVLDLLEENQGKIVSGEEIAKRIGVTRNSVWKAIKALKNDGYNIFSQSNTGYIFSKDNEIFTSSKIKSLSKNDINVLVLDSVTSSNDIAKSMANQSAPEGTIVVAKRQSNGRGRMGRSFISNEENGLYMSIILRPQISASDSVKITVIGAVATLEAIEETSNQSCQIKWVNDIYIKDKKVCGILTEGAFNVESGSFDYAILGIGINITPPENGFENEIENIATSIYEKDAPKDYKSRLCALIIDKFFDYYKNIKNEAYIDEYRKKLNLIGKRIVVIRGNEEIEGEVVDIDNDANLIVKNERGIFKFNSGEARVRK